MDSRRVLVQVSGKASSSSPGTGHSGYSPLRSRYSIAVRMCKVNLTWYLDQMSASACSPKRLQPYRLTLRVHQCRPEPKVKRMHACKLYNGRQHQYALVYQVDVATALTGDADTARVNAEMCMLSDESQRRSVIVYTIIVYAIALTLVALRVAGKVVSKRLAWNDAPIVAAVLLAAVPIGCVLASRSHQANSSYHY